MAEGDGKAREIDLGREFGDVNVKANGTQIRICANGHVETSPKTTSAGDAVKAVPKVGYVLPPVHYCWGGGWYYGARDPTLPK